jgi:hypothetical protein
MREGRDDNEKDSNAPDQKLILQIKYLSNNSRQRLKTPYYIIGINKLRVYMAISFIYDLLPPR